MRILLTLLLILVGGVLKAEDYIKVTISGGMRPVSEEWRIEAGGQVSYIFDKLQNDDDLEYRGVAPDAYQQAVTVLRRKGFDRLYRFCRRESASYEPPFAYDKPYYDITWSRNGQETTYSDGSCPEGYDITNWYVRSIDGLADSVSNIVNQALSR